MTASTEGAAPESRPLLEGRGLSKSFGRPGGLFRARGLAEVVRAVDGVDLRLVPGESFALVGESGSGKTTIARLLLRLLEPTEGRILFDGADITTRRRSELRDFRRDCQMIFQDPAGSLDPRMRVGPAVAEPLVIHRMASGAELDERCRRLLDLVGLPETVRRSFPGELSGGQRQRVAIARALATGPRVLVADEPVTALDVSIRAQIVDLIARLQRELELSLLFIGHDLAVVFQVADRVGVMFAGRLVEVAPRRDLYTSPLHPYSSELLAAVPRFDRRERRSHRATVGAASSRMEPTSTGCPFRSRCPIAVARCASERPSLVPLEANRLVACHRPGQLSGTSDLGQDNLCLDNA